MLTTNSSSYYGLLVIKLFLIVQFLSTCTNGELKGDLFSSREALLELYKSENIAMGLLRDYVQENKVDHDYLEKTLLEFETAQWKALVNPVEYLSNPVNAFMLLKRLSVDWPIVVDLTDNLNGALKKVEELSLPTESDLLSAVLSLERLQNTYNLSASDLRVLNINGIQYPGIVMKPMDCFEIGRQLYGNAHFGRASEWFEESLENMEEMHYFINALYYLSYSYYKSGYKKESAERFKILSEVIGLNSNKTADVIKYRNIIKNMRTIKTTYDPKEDEWNSDVKYYRKLCRGEELRTPKQQVNLKCRYVNDHSPFLKIAPLKLEILNEVPFIAQYYDVISDSEIAVLKELATPNLTDSAVYNDGAYERLSSRISKIQWLLEDEHPLLKTLSRRIEDMTALSAEYSEPLQIASYGIGGHYVPHYDWFGYRRDVPERDRIATLMFYMSEVQQGGGTAFTRAHVLVKPVKGSAAMWYNLYKDGEGDESTFHGACPVLVGQKWAANKWLHEYGNEFERKCDLVQDSLS
uniref:procollagen-proline 4-dioxygenase n=1 Tax=Culicoides sonorensis TaxID=179676 RepID=A0A336MJ21_CULSO